jgi:hypothetical protein
MSDHLLDQIRLSFSSAQIAEASHPDADTLTAFRERKLSSCLRNTIAEHLCVCAACREVLAFSSSSSLTVRFAGRQWRRIAAAAVLAVGFASSLSRTEDGVPRVVIEGPVRGPATARYAVDRSPNVSYASAELLAPAINGPTYVWRVRKKGPSAVLEASPDGGRNWRTAELNERFEPKAVGFKGSDVWVTGATGMLLSRDSGRHWLHLQPLQKR